MRAVKINDGPRALVVQEVDGGYETTVGWVPYEKVKPVTDCQGAFVTFEAKWKLYLPVQWPVLKAFDSKLEPGYLKDVDFKDNSDKPFVFTDGRVDSVVSMVCPIDNDWPDNVKNKN